MRFGSKCMLSFAVFGVVVFSSGLSTLAENAAIIGGVSVTDAVVKIPVGQRRDVTFSFRGTGRDNVTRGLEVNVTAASRDDAVVRLVTPVSEVVDIRGDVGSNVTCALEGVRIGIAKLRWHFDADGFHTENETEVRIVRKENMIAMGVSAVIGILVALNNVNIGCQLNIQVIKAQLKKPVAPAIGMFCQFAFMPTAAFAYGYWILKTPEARIGLFTLGCSPGGIYSNFWTLLFQGDLDLSVTMTFLSSIGALGMMPLWMNTLGTLIGDKNTPAVPIVNLMISLVALTVPLGIGLLVQYKKPTWVKTSLKIVKPFSIGILVVAMIIGAYSYWYMFTIITWRDVISGCLIVVTGYMFGAIAAFLVRLNKKQIIAVSLETGIQNVPLAFVILTFSLPEPKGDLAAVPVGVQAVATGIILMSLYLLLSLYRVFKERSYKMSKTPPPPSISVVQIENSADSKPQ